MLLSRAHPLANKERITSEDLREYIELVHGDLENPKPLALADARRNQAEQQKKKSISVYERGSQFDLLTGILRRICGFLRCLKKSLEGTIFARESALGPSATGMCSSIRKAISSRRRIRRFLQRFARCRARLWQRGVAMQKQRILVLPNEKKRIRAWRIQSACWRCSAGGQRFLCRRR